MFEAENQATKKPVKPTIVKTEQTTKRQREDCQPEWGETTEDVDQETPWFPHATTTSSKTVTWATDEAYMNLHSVHNLTTFKHDIAVITQDEDIAKKTLMSVLKGRFKIETMVKIIEAENPNITWLKRHHNAMEALAQANKHTQQLIAEAGLKERNREQKKNNYKGKGGKGSGR